ncbi:MAG: peptide-methionine (S)-S-oxide reductase MsrA [bacterium]
MEQNKKKEYAIFAGGCFWCVEHDLRNLDGVLDAVSGYTGGETKNPSYENHFGHLEAVKVIYDFNKTNFKKLCQFFLDNIDPTDAGGQFTDRGESYQTAIFYKTEDEKNIAQGLLKELDESKIYNNKVVVKILPEKEFFKAEEYHQRYAEKNPAHYNAYKEGSGRSNFQALTCAIRDQKKIQWKD